MNTNRQIRDWFPDIFGDSHPSVVVELGAYIGNDTEAIREAAGGDSCRYFALEPDPINAAAFRIRFDGVPITFICAAISDRCGIARFRRSRPFCESGSIKVPRQHLEKHPDVSFPKELEIDIPTLTLDEIFQTFAIWRIDFVWADVQGAEDLMIAGGHKALSKTRWLYTEFSDCELYEKQPTLERIHQSLPGDWEIAQQWDGTALFRNIGLKA